MNIPFLVLSTLLGIAMSLKAAPSIVWQSNIGANNLQSDCESAIDETFTFELGAFANGFIPTDENREEWVTHWEAIDAEGYSNLTRAFSGNHNFQSNNGPFAAGEQAFIWGFQSRDVSAEWILMADESWRWPVASSAPPAPGGGLNFLVDDVTAEEVIAGAANTEDFHLKTSVPPLTYERWITREFSELEQMEAATISRTGDPDGDGLVNLLEYATGGDPNEVTSEPFFRSEAIMSETSSIFRFVVERDPEAAVQWSVERSAALLPETFVPVDVTTAEDTPDRLVLEVTVDLLARPTDFFRLRVTDN